ncbi:GntR family transcriptional regulator [Lederbergia graminis]|uniref:GntR family transcriptional regulator n=1 Tax=Lederbergia graminis TaxID=735518 RepID=A0ABW0LKF0_9BACI
MGTKPKRIAKYKMIENDIFNKINNGDFVTGQLIPTEQELAAEYNVSRVTVRQATNNLVAKGYLVRNQGSGTFVAKQSVVGRATKVKSFSEEMTELGKEVTTDILVFKVITASERISKKLKIKVDAPVYYFERLRKADGEPMMYEISYMDVAEYPDLSYEKLKGSKYKYAEEYKETTVDYSHHAIIPIMPTSEIVDYFGIDPEMPILKVMNTTYLSNGAILDYTELLLNTERYQYQVIKAK